MILEAMKMEIGIVAERAGVIKSIEVKVNDAVVGWDRLLRQTIGVRGIGN